MVSQLEINSTTNRMSVHFVSDQKINSGGFTVIYSIRYGTSMASRSTIYSINQISDLIYQISYIIYEISVR